MVVRRVLPPLGPFPAYNRPLTSTEHPCLYSPGSRLGPYEVTAKIGQGGMGEVCLARSCAVARVSEPDTNPAPMT